jgi:hypothetical protein
LNVLARSALAKALQEMPFLVGRRGAAGGLHFPVCCDLLRPLRCGLRPICASLQGPAAAGCKATPCAQRVRCCAVLGSWPQLLW